MDDQFDANKNTTNPGANYQNQDITSPNQPSPINPESIEPTTPDVVVAGAVGASGVVAQSPKKKSRWPLIIALVLLLAGAGAAAWYLTKDDSPTTLSAAQTTKSDIAVVRVGATFGPIGNDYLFPNPAPANTATQIDFQVFEGLTGFDNQRTVPLLATSWTNPDNTTWVFSIKKNVKFQNGKTLTADDVKQSLDALIKDEDWGFYLQTIDSVAVTGTNQVTIKTTAPDALLLNRLAYGFISSKNADGTVSGTGAYTIDASKSKTESQTRLVAYEGYHQGAPSTKSIEYTIYDSNEALNKALADKKLDIASAQDTGSFKNAAKALGFNTYDYENSGSYGLVLNMAKAGSPLAKKEVRQALALAIDRADYVKKSADSKHATQYVIPKTVVGYDATAKFPDLDVAKAKALQTAAGYPNGAPLTFLYIQDLQTDAPIVIDELKAAGFQVTAKPMPTPKEFVAAAQSGTYDMISGTYTSDLGDGSDVFAGLLGSSDSQFPFYKNAAFDKMLTDAQSAFEPADHIKKVQAINRFIASEFLYIPVSSKSNSVYYPKTYNYQFDSVTGVDGTYFWKVSQNNPASN